MDLEIDKEYAKSEEEGCETVTKEGDVNTADNHLASSCMDLLSTTTQHLNETRKTPPSAMKYESSSSSNSKKLVVFIGASYNTFVVLGFPFAIGALYTEILDTFNSSRRETSLVPAFCVGCTFGVGFLSGLFIKRSGMKTVLTAGGLVSSLGLFSSWFAQSVVHLVVTVGVLNGIGNSFIFMSTTTLVADTFNSRGRRSLALAGIMFSGGIGTILFSYILTALNSVYGWRGTFLLISCFYLQIIVSASVTTSSAGNLQFFRRQQPKDDNTGKDYKPKWKQLLKPVFISFVITSCLSFGTGNNTSGILSDLAKSRGFSEERGLALILYFNSVNTMSRLLSGILKTIPGLHSIVIFTMAAALLGVSLIFLGASSDWVPLAVLTSTAGAGMGGMQAMLPIVSVEVLALEMLPIGLGLCGMMNGAVTPIFGTVMGFMFDNSGSYEVPFYVNGSIAAGAAALTMIVFTIMECRCNKQRSHSVIRL